MADSTNPFSLFFSSAEAIEQQKNAVERQRSEMGHALTRIFLCTPSSSVKGDVNRPRFVVVLPQLAKDQERLGKEGDLDLERLSQGLVERLQMTDLSSSVVHCQLGMKNSGLLSKSHAVEKSNLIFLAQCFARACQERGDNIEASVFAHMVEECKRLIVEMCGPVLERAFSEPSFTNLLLDSLDETTSVAVPVEFFYRIADSCAVDFPKLKALFEPSLMKVFAMCDRISLSCASLVKYLSVLTAYSNNCNLAKVMVESECWLPPAQNRTGKAFETQTLFGRLLRLSSLAPSSNLPSEHFPMDRAILNKSDVESMTCSVQAQLDLITSHMHKVFSRLLRSGEDTKRALIRWLVECMEKNQDRGKMMSRLLSAQHLISYASDGFFLNLGLVMLRLAAPFTQGDSPTFRLPYINPLYCTAAMKPALITKSQGTLLNFTSETKMVPADSEDEELTPQLEELEAELKFNFITHCFFLTHKSLTLGMSQTMQSFADLMRLYGKTFHVLESISRAGDRSSPLYHQIHTQFLLLHSQVQGIKAHLGHPQLQHLCLMFNATTARWLVLLATQESHDISTLSHDPEILFPLPKKAPAQMNTVPECLVDNMAHFITYLGRSQSDILSSGTHMLGHLITFATVFMGSPQYIQNPHLRANIAQLVSLMIPRNNEKATSLIPASSESQRTLFETHQVANTHLIRVIMTIFVDIEYTGDSMEFEAKFQYRIPMYEVLRFVWELPSYQASVDTLTREAVQYDGTQQEIPIFLRFINMIINDATLQLDEGLENLVLIGELQGEKRSEEWQAYTDEQKKEHQLKMAEATQMAGNRNLLSSYTVNVLELVTRTVQAPFVLPSMGLRIATMLNYVLKQLVGPKRRQLNVENMEKFHFHPKELVYKIVCIYVNLGQRSEFYQALPQDGRSFSLSLMNEAAQIMRTLGHGEMMGKLRSLIEKVRQYSVYLQMEESALDDAPEEFLDPLTNELMKEPVRLPTSGITMDKPSIIRHLLSDSTDPFNRSPLTADMLEPDSQLKQRIEQWRTEKLTNLKKASTE